MMASLMRGGYEAAASGAMLVGSTFSGMLRQGINTFSQMAPGIYNTMVESGQRIYDVTGGYYTPDLPGSIPDIKTAMLTQTAYLLSMATDDMINGSTEIVQGLWQDVQNDNRNKYCQNI
jgi:hypothetical protein